MSNKGINNTQDQIEDIADKSGWLRQYKDLKSTFTYPHINQGGKTVQKKITWKKAALVAWDACPKKNRQPATLEKLADLLNIKSQSTLHRWKNEDWYEDCASGFREKLFGDNLSDVDAKTIHAAKNEDGASGVRARELFYKQVSDIKEGYDIGQQIEDEIKRITGIGDSE